ncbi:hypothetical protein HID58_095507, partial [Brassica napus]
MADHCMVISSEWTSGDFEIMSRIVPVCPDMPLLELQNNVVNEYFLPSNTRELATRLTTQPIILRMTEEELEMNDFIDF